MTERPGILVTDVKVIIRALESEPLKLTYDVRGKSCFARPGVRVDPKDGQLLPRRIGGFFRKKIPTAISPVLKVISGLDPLARAVNLEVVFMWHVCNAEV